MDQINFILEDIPSDLDQELKTQIQNKKKNLINDISETGLNAVHTAINSSNDKIIFFLIEK